MRCHLALAVLFAATVAASAQWEIQTVDTTANFRGIHALGNGIAWASGSEGTVLRTTDDGAHWQLCAMPPGGENLDFRGIQGFDEKTAIVMSSGKGDLSRLYKTTDACQTWTLLFANPDAPNGFFDAMLFLDPDHGILFGDPSPTGLATQYEGDFRIRVTANAGTTWAPVSAPDTSSSPGDGLHPLKNESAYAASNSAMASVDNSFWFATSAGRVSSRKFFEGAHSEDPFFHKFLFRSMYCAGAIDSLSGECGQPWVDFRNSAAPIRHNTESSGIFSIAFRSERLGQVVGGDYLRRDDPTGTAAFTIDGGQTWKAAQTPPHGYRSSVANSVATKTWITVGPNGTDISIDDGRNWRALTPGPNDPPDADRNWNALSLPFVVGPHGRIGKLRPEALAPTPTAAKP